MWKNSRTYPRPVDWQASLVLSLPEHLWCFLLMVPCSFLGLCSLSVGHKTTKRNNSQSSPSLLWHLWKHGPLLQNKIWYHLHFFNLIFSLFTFQMLSPFLVLPLNSLILSPKPLILWGCSSTHPLPPPCPGIFLDWGMEPSQDRGPLFPLMPNQAILCSICNWSHESLHVHSSFGVIVPESSGWLILLFFYGDANPFSSLSPFSHFSTMLFNVQFLKHALEGHLVVVLHAIAMSDKISSTPHPAPLV